VNPDAPPVVCAWCDAPLAGPGSSARPGGLQCARCGVVTTSPWPSDDELSAAYAGWYRPEGGRFAGAGDALLRALRQRLARRLDAIAPPGRLLDVGAGDGALVAAIAAGGREALGLEREDGPPGVEACEIDEMTGEWAGVVFWHSLEHLRAPGAALDQAAKLLAPGGVVVVAVPNAGSVQARAFGERWFALDPPRHLVHVPASALLERLRRNGLQVERVSYVRGGQVTFGWLHGLVGMLPGNPSLYDALRKPSARSRPLSPGRRLAALTGAVVLLPVALGCALVEVGLRRGGSVYVEARGG
jgi:SAM-dependent methyltransferase